MRSIFTLLLAMATMASTGQDIKTYVQQHTVPVRSVSPSDTTYEDLEALGAAIGDARIVMLGEQDHGDAPAFLAKARIIKYLHEKKGFNVLAFESDFFGLNQGLDLQPGGNSFLRRNIFPMWTDCDACGDLFYQYLPATRKTANPLVVTGFDNQMILDYSGNNLVHRLDSLLRALQLPITQRPDYAARIKPALDSLSYFYGPRSAGIEHIRNYLALIREELKGKLAADDFWMMVVDNLVSEGEQFHFFHKDPYKSRYLRDEQMARNLRWLASNKYPNQKIMVWAANGHVGKFNQGNGRAQMGYLFTSDEYWLKQTYVLGFTSFSGEAGRIYWEGTYKVPKPAKEGFERWIDPKLKQAYVDFSAYRKLFPGKKTSFQLKGLAHHTMFSYDWTSVFDGVFYIRDMYPCGVNKSLGH